jgi:DNA-directed RNA polymerase specialized sigma24 family protein
MQRLTSYHQNKPGSSRCCDWASLTIAKALRKSEKTIRLHRDRAFKALREALSPENDDD